ncbi:MAG: DNA ligase D [Sneathiella sp.]
MSKAVKNPERKNLPNPKAKRAHKTMAKNALEKYNEKRDFRITTEPPGKTARSKKSKLAFTVQKHGATRLHYDFRLEWGGILWSWAVPKGPSYCPQDKRLAVRTEDHPLSYHDFEGLIPANQYGAGPVMLWDAGNWEPLDDDPEKSIKEGSLKFILHGEKLAGEWALVRMHTKDKNRENWLLIKHKDMHAIDAEDKGYLKKADYSVKTGRQFDEIAAFRNTEKEKNKTKGTKSKKGKSKSGFRDLHEKYKGPQLATLVSAPPKGKDWVHEVKYDGYRIMVFFINGEVRIHTCNGHDWTDKFPVLKEAFEKLEIGSFVIDGEAVVIDEDGLSDFQSLQNALGESDMPMQGYFFDLLHWDGEDYTKRTFSDRRKALENLFKEIPDGPLYVSEIIEGKADKVIDKACTLGLEGIISKRTDAEYVQKRAKSWVKSKCVKRQEFIICGFLPASDMPEAIGSLHLGYHKGGKLSYAGKVGTGFTYSIAEKLYKKLKKLKVKKPPFDQKPDTRMNGTTWVKPQLLCEVRFAMWTATGKIRHASYQGLREDKEPESIVKEEPKTMKSQKADKNKIIKSVTISHADREIFPQAHITKGALAEFYAEMEEHIMPDIKNRPISVVRCPGGIDKQCFFQRSKGKGMPEHIYTIDINHKGKTHDYLYVKNITGLVELVQMGGIEMHPWGVQIDKIEKPDHIIFDLDPDEAIPFEAIKLAAQDVRARLDNLGLQSFLKCTGGKGLHVTAPIQRRHDWETVKSFCRNFARQMEADVPDAYTINMSKKKRTGKIFIDYLRNDFASTAVMNYCVRARPGAAVAVPLDWAELKDLDAANQYSIKDVLERKKKNKLFDYPQIRQSLTKEILNEVQ